jgi:hypothetical protein
LPNVSVTGATVVLAVTGTTGLESSPNADPWSARDAHTDLSRKTT